jgi:GWxTD domain-containing protein
MGEIPLEDLPSGNYNLVMEARNRENELLAQNAVFFQRSNILPFSDTDDFRQRDISNTFASYITGRDTLAEYINSLFPIASPLEITFLNNQLKIADVKIMQQFFYDFWVRRNPINPEKAWVDYNIEVMKVNNEFGNRVRKGHQTEQGRIYLKYGPPNTITRSHNEPSAYPYEIWHYYKLGNQTNRKFVFYNPDLVSRDFVLLHSDAQGEPFNNQWQMLLYKRDTQTRSYDEEEKGIDYFGNKAGDNFANPR